MLGYASVSAMLVDKEDESANVFALNKDFLAMYYSPAVATSVHLFIASFDS